MDSEKKLIKMFEDALFNSNTRATFTTRKVVKDASTQYDIRDCFPDKDIIADYFIVQK